jgi:hypothetical protein
MKHALSYIATVAALTVAAGAFLTFGLGIALMVVGGLFLGLSVYSAERINNVSDTD